MAHLAILLRAVNIGPGLRVTSADLRDAADDAGLGDPRTLLNSGNLVATPGTSGADGPAEAARLVQDRLTERLGRPVAAVGLSAAQLEDIARANPFPAAARDDPSHLQVHVPLGALDEAAVARLDLANAGRELLATAAGVLYVHYADGIGRSRLTSAVIDRAVGAPTTARNWNTITKLRAACADDAA
ncbi:DUF1697 domain-containing protein [Promicromonospora thailandica]|uniref:Uncharacterized conserved protein, DUF1697 family n=1 Tax=Promicromonospora thailandica TaxID=765201 RepID=A0A9X2G4I5_9MICO|nr:DUF1697 domain-containing protein [Promicromonospora thailandica]MCP2263109.1 Uncharacterized conserved protein, DUF1697 family [Promicromonospora thailandica]BFF18487.1 DUF1697 domain-containing protein [Promicromonospora thailandica]